MHAKKQNLFDFFFTLCKEFLTLTVVFLKPLCLITNDAFKVIWASQSEKITEIPPEKFFITMLNKLNLKYSTTSIRRCGYSFLYAQ